MDTDIKVPIFIESRYKLNRTKVKDTVCDALKKQDIKGPVEVSVAIVGDRKMKRLNKKYRDLDKTTNVLSFSQMEGSTNVLPQDVLILGDVVVSYPQAILEASKEEMLVDDKICELVEHGVMHLLGIHHE
ncbi:MAG: rRNA maturation RNase YbeY [Candidatus Levybacteria bacterium RIFCSPHIGHO2_01_FULL_36_15]|nr:MAG: rRNA maturation RNase YbeY [Candidatus Levybacteria bacterium RIFCSPHIGHO2_01_FULL_36_15]OGH39271.1 MAG: rRNA maturation RNase YbeY [Candidatus Levybacteria bacterium RIFCSPLOWO2_01_FULL_36_10]